MRRVGGEPRLATRRASPRAGARWVTLLVVGLLLPIGLLGLGGSLTRLTPRRRHPGRILPG